MLLARDPEALAEAASAPVRRPRRAGRGRRARARRTRAAQPRAHLRSRHRGRARLRRVAARRGGRGRDVHAATDVGAHGADAPGRERVVALSSARGCRRAPRGARAGTHARADGYDKKVLLRPGAPGAAARRSATASSPATSTPIALPRDALGSARAEKRVRRPLSRRRCRRTLTAESEETAGRP